MLAEMVATAVGFTGDTIWDPSKPNGQPRRHLDVGRAVERFGFKAGTSLKDGIARTRSLGARTDAGVRLVRKELRSLMPATNTNEVNLQGVDVLGVSCIAADLDTAAQRVIEMVQRGDGGYVSTCNVHVVVTANRNPQYRAALEGAAMRVPDGWPVAWMQRRLGIGSARRIPGPDLMEHLLNVGTQDNLSHFLLGSTPGVLLSLENQISKRLPSARVVGTYSPSFDELGDDRTQTWCT